MRADTDEAKTPRLKRADGLGDQRGDWKPVEATPEIKLSFCENAC
jgi:hypothetical protein